MRTATFKSHSVKSAMFGVGIPFVGLLFHRWLPQPAAVAVGIFLWSMLFYFVPPKWSQRTFPQHLVLSLAISAVIFVITNVM